MRQGNRAIGMFLVLVVVLSTLMTIFSYLLGVKLATLAPLYMFTPFISAMITCHSRKIPITSLGLSIKPNKWFLFAWLFPPLLSFSALGISLFFPGVEYSETMEGLARYGIPPGLVAEKYGEFGIQPMPLILLLGLLVGPTLNALFAFGEEFGWRGFLQSELAHLGFWKSSFLIGLIWGLWHIPLIAQGYNYPEHPFPGVGMMILFTTLLSPIFSYIRIKADSVIAAAIMHGTLNAVAGIPVAFVKGGSDLIIGIHGISGLLVLGAVNALLIVKGRGKPGLMP